MTDVKRKTGHALLTEFWTLAKAGNLNKEERDILWADMGLKDPFYTEMFKKVNKRNRFLKNLIKVVDLIEEEED